jgi:hypothetical protein
MKIAPIEFAIFCDHASVSMDGKLSMNGIFERILTKEIPVMHPMMFVVTKLILPEGDHSITFTLMQEDEVLAKSNADKKVEGKLGSHVHFWNIKNLKVEKTEPVELQILIDGKQVFVKRLPVVIVEPKGQGKKNDKKD